MTPPLSLSFSLSLSLSLFYFLFFCRFDFVRLEGWYFVGRDQVIQFEMYPSLANTWRWTNPAPCEEFEGLRQLRPCRVQVIRCHSTTCVGATIPRFMIYDDSVYPLNFRWTRCRSLARNHARPVKLAILSSSRFTGWLNHRAITPPNQKQMSSLGNCLEHHWKQRAS